MISLSTAFICDLGVLKTLNFADDWKKFTKSRLLKKCKKEKNYISEKMVAGIFNLGLFNEMKKCHVFWITPVMYHSIVETMPELQSTLNSWNLQRILCTMFTALSLRVMLMYTLYIVQCTSSKADQRCYVMIALYTVNK